FFRYVNIFEQILTRVIGFEGVDWIQVAAGPVVIGKNLQPVVYTPHYELGGEDVRHRTVLKGHVYLAIVFDIVVGGGQEALVAKVSSPGDLRRAGTDGRGPDGPVVARLAFDPLQMKRCGERMAAFTHQRAAT